MTKQQQIDALKHTNRELTDQVRDLTLRYGLVADLVNDAGCALARGLSIDAHVHEAFRQFHAGTLALDRGPYTKPLLIGYGHADAGSTDGAALDERPDRSGLGS